MYFVLQRFLYFRESCSDVVFVTKTKAQPRMPFYHTKTHETFIAPTCLLVIVYFNDLHSISQFRYPINNVWYGSPSDIGISFYHWN